MIGHLHHVSGPRRRRGWSGLSRYTVTVGVQNTCTAAWREESFGPLADPWIPTVGNAAPEARLSYLVALAAAYLRRISGGAWDAHLDDPTRPHALVMTKPGDTTVLPVSIEGRVVRVSRSGVSMAMAGTGMKVLELIAVRAGSFFGAVA